MRTSSSSFPARDAQGPGWIRSFSLRRIGIMVLLLALLVIVTSYLLQSKLNYPADLLDKAFFANALLAQGEIVAVLGLVGLMLGGGLLLLISLGLAPNLEEKRRRRVSITGGTAGMFWTISALLGLILVPIWESAPTAVTHVLATLILMLAEIATPLLLAFWTLTLARQFRAHRVLSWVGAIGLLLVMLRSLLWGLNALLPIESGFYATAGIVNVLAVLGESFWLLWLLLFGFHLLAKRAPETSIAQARPRDATSEGQKHMKRRGFLKVGTSLGTGLAGGVFVLARIGLTIANTPSVESDEIPSEPSLLGSLFYWGILIPRKYLQAAQTFQQMRAQNQETAQEPSGVSVGHISAGGVPSTLYRASGATSDRFILYLHGGGLVLPVTNTHRSFCAKLSQAIGASVLLPEYRLAPEYPYPAPLDDCLAAYHWIREQSVASSRIAIAGESGGGYLTLATALALRDRSEPLPAALVPISAAVLEPTFSGESYATKAVADPVVTIDLARESLAAYTNKGAIDARNPLISPLYADLHGLSPTLIQVGSQEVFLSDNVNFAHRAQAAGVSVQLEVWPGMWHAFPILVAVLSIPDATQAFQHIVKYIRQHLGR